MSQSSQPVKQLRSALNEEAKRLIVDALYTGRGHQVAGARWLEIHHWLGVPAAVTTTLLAGSATLSAVLEWNSWLTAGLALSSAITSASSSFLKPKEKADEYTLKGNRFIAIRNQARMYQQIDLRSSQTDEELSAEIKRIRSEYDKLNETPPLQIPRWAYERARKNITDGESNYENDPVWAELGD